MRKAGAVVCRVSWVIAVAAWLGLAGCSGDETSNYYGADAGTSGATFTAFGKVVDEAGTPLGGAEVCAWLPGGAECAQTEEGTGLWSLAGLPTGSDFLVSAQYTRPPVVDGDGTEVAPEAPYFRYERLFDASEVFDGADLVPSGAQLAFDDIVLVPGGFGMDVLVYANSAPAEGVEVVLELESPTDATLTATTGADGIASFEGLPVPSQRQPVPFQLVTFPYDRDGDGSADFGPRRVEGGTLWDLAPDIAVVELDDLGDFRVLYTSVDGGELADGDPIEIYFNQRLSDVQVELRLLDDDRPLPTDYEVTVASGIKAVIRTDDPLPWWDYEIAVVATSTNGSTVAFSREFAAGGFPEMTAVTGVTVTVPAADSTDWDTAVFTLAWDAVPGARRYNVYGLSTVAGDDPVLVASVDADPLSEDDPSAEVDLSGTASFDTVADDGLFTPLEGGAEITFVVRAVNGEGEEGPTGDLTAMPNVRDAVAPALTSVSRIPLLTRLSVSVDGSEYLDTGATPEIAFFSSSTGDEIPTVICTDWSWNEDARGAAVLCRNVPLGGYTYTITGFRDTSGNGAGPLEGTAP